MTARFLKITSFLIFLFPAISFADSTQNIIDQQDWIIRNQQNILEEKKRNSEFDAIKKDHELKKKEEQDLLQPTVSGKMRGGCISIKEINFSGSHSITKSNQQKIIAPFIGKCMEAEVLASVIKTVSDYYHAKGMITTQVKVPKQNLQSGIFELQIIEGKVEKISLGKPQNECGVTCHTQLFTAFGNIEGKTLNISDINQGISQINRLQSNSATIKIEPGNEIGASKVVIDNNKKFPAHFNIGKDNLGNNFTGVQRTNLSAAIDNLLFLNDNINLSYSINTRDENQIKDIKSFSAASQFHLVITLFLTTFRAANIKEVCPIKIM